MAHDQEFEIRPIHILALVCSLLTVATFVLFVEVKRSETTYAQRVDQIQKIADDSVQNALTNRPYMRAIWAFHDLQTACTYLNHRGVIDPDDRECAVMLVDAIPQEWIEDWYYSESSAQAMIAHVAKAIPVRCERMQASGVAPHNICGSYQSQK